MAFTTKPFLHQKQPSRESIFCGEAGGWCAKRAVSVLKLLPKTGQERLWCVRCVWATAHKTRTLTNTSASGCRACCSRLTKTASWKRRNHLLEIQKPPAGNTETICWKHRNHLLKTQKLSAENTEISYWKHRNHLPLAASFQVVGKALNPNWWFGRLSIISGCFHRFLLVFRLLVGILCVLFFLCSPLRLQE